MKKSLLLSGLFVALLFSACTRNKDPDPTPLDSTAAKLQGKWTLEKMINIVQEDTLWVDSFYATDYWDFKADNKIYALAYGCNFSTMNYHIINADSVQIDQMVYHITTLSEKKLNLSSYSDIGNGELQKIYVELKK